MLSPKQLCKQLNDRFTGFKIVLKQILTCPKTLEEILFLLSGPAMTKFLRKVQPKSRRDATYNIKPVYLSQNVPS